MPDDNARLHQLGDSDIELERYELFAGPRYHFHVDRREFLKLAAGGAIVVVAVTDALAQESGGGRATTGERYPSEVGAWLRIDRDGKVTAYTGKVEIGQNARTSLTQAIVEELLVEPSAVTIVMGDTALTPYDLGTFGSRTTPIMGTQLRRAAAATRELLIDLAADRWHVDRATLKADEGRVSDPERRRDVSYGELADGQKLVRAIDTTLELAPADRWRISGTSLPKVNGRDIVTGRHRYTSDMKMEGMLYGLVLRPTRLGERLVSLNADAAKRMPGVTVVRDGDFVGVTAPTFAQAVAARNALNATWRNTPLPSSRELFPHLKATADPKAQTSHVVGNVDDVLAKASQKLEATYTVDYIAHAPLEPRAALAWWSEGANGTLTVMTGTQRPFGVQSELAEALRLPTARVRVQVPDTGSAYGGKHTGDAAIEAARLARAAARPVKVVWSRDEEFTWGYFRPAGVIEVRSALAADGTIAAWDFVTINAGPAAIRPLYDIPNQRIEFRTADSPLRQGSYRGLAATANHFARESHLDELARLVQIDPLELRKRNLKDQRLLAVLDQAAERFRWSQKNSTANHGFGLAAGFEKGSYVATCTEVTVDPTTQRVKVLRIVTAFECGAIVNPDGVKNQVEGALIQGLGGALFETIHINDSQVIEANFADYRVPRFNDVPDIDVIVLDRKDLPPAGAGETPLVALAPAIANAMFDATGKRVRHMPLNPRPLILGTGQ